MFEDIKNTLEIIKNNIVAIGKFFGIIIDVLGFIGLQTLLLLIITSFFVRFLALISPNNKKINYILGVGVAIYLALKANMAFNPIILKYLAIASLPFIVSILVFFIKRIIRYTSKKINLGYYIYCFKNTFYINKVARLKKGDVVGITISSKNIETDILETEKSEIEALGLTYKIYNNETLIANGTFLSNIDEEKRAIQFSEALNDSESKIIYNLSYDEDEFEIIPYLKRQKNLLKKKNFIFYGNNTILSNLLIEKWDMVTIYSNIYISDLFSILLQKKERSFEKELKILNNFNKKGNLSGKLIGGTLQSILYTLGTKSSINCRDKILLLDNQVYENNIEIKDFAQIAEHIVDTKNTPKAIILSNFLDENNLNEFEIIKNKIIKRLKDDNINIPIFYNNNEEVTYILNYPVNIRKKEDKIILQTKF